MTASGGGSCAISISTEQGDLEHGNGHRYVQNMECYCTRATGKGIIDCMGDGRKLSILPWEFDLGTVMRPTERKFGSITERERCRPRDPGGPFEDLVASLFHHRPPPLRRERRRRSGSRGSGK